MFLRLFPDLVRKTIRQIRGRNRFRTIIPDPPTTVLSKSGPVAMTSGDVAAKGVGCWSQAACVTLN